MAKNEENEEAHKIEDEYMPDDADEESEDDDENSEGDEEESEADEEDVKSEAVPDTLELDEEEWGKMVINAERFKTLGERRLIRFASVFERAEAGAKIKSQKELDASDDAKVKGDKKEHRAIIACKRGKWTCEVDEKGRPLSKKLLYDPQADDIGVDDCECQVCTARRANSTKLLDRAKEFKTRSGGNFNWDGKYGGGRRLGD